jgi:hypothetical protein
LRVFGSTAPLPGSSLVAGGRRQFAEIFAAADNKLGRMHMLGHPVALTKDIARSG